jgi:hypothetical protein
MREWIQDQLEAFEFIEVQRCEVLVHDDDFAQEVNLDNN